jgi:hypothetical protein
MDVQTAVDYINDVSFMPGWTIKAVPWGDDYVYVDVDLYTQNSARAEAPYGYKKMIHIGDYFLVNVAGKSPIQVDQEVISQLLKIQEHEAREFYRHRQAYPEKWTALFHPHQKEGQIRWGDGHVRTDSRV